MSRARPLSEHQRRRIATTVTRRVIEASERSWNKHKLQDLANGLGLDQEQRGRLEDFLRYVLGEFERYRHLRNSIDPVIGGIQLTPGEMVATLKQMKTSCFPRITGNHRGILMRPNKVKGNALPLVLFSMIASSRRSGETYRDTRKRLIREIQPRIRQGENKTEGLAVGYAAALLLRFSGGEAPGRTSAYHHRFVVDAFSIIGIPATRDFRSTEFRQILRRARLLNEKTTKRVMVDEKNEWAHLEDIPI